jgi:hypothetical protein
MHMTRLLTLVAALGLAPLATAQNVPSYDAEILDLVSRVNEMGPGGHIVGWKLTGTYPNARELAYVAPPGGSVTLLPMPAGHDRSNALDVNGSGVIVGTVSPIGQPMVIGKPVRWVPQQGGGYSVEFLTLPPGFSFGSADRINEVGDIVGGGHTGNPFSVAGVHFPANGPSVSYQALGINAFIALNDEGLAIDSSSPPLIFDLAAGHTVGGVSVPPAAPNAPLGFKSILVHDFTNNGRIVGAARLPPTFSDVYSFAAAFEPGQGWTLNSAGGTSDTVLDVNEGGDSVDVVGTALHLCLDGQSSVAVDGLIEAPAGTGPWQCLVSEGAAIDEQRVIACVAMDNSNGVCRLVRLTPRVTFQSDLGFAGPGNGRLTVCGGDMSQGTTAELAVVGATPSSLAYIGVSLTSNPTPCFGGVAVPFPPQLLVPLPIDGAGVGRISAVAGGTGPFSVYVQGAWIDANLPQFVGMSNAVRIDVLP